MQLTHSLYKFIEYFLYLQKKKIHKKY